MHRIIIFLLTLVLWGGVTCYAEEYDYGAAALAEAVPPEAAAALSEAEITPESGWGSVGLYDALKYILSLVEGQLKSPLRLLMSLLGVILLCTLSGSASDMAQDKLSGLFGTVGVLSGGGLVVAAVSQVLDETLELLSTASLFITAFIPIFAGILSVMGRTATASAINLVTLAATQLFSQLSVNLLAPLCSAIMGLSITGAIHPQLNLSRLSELIRKAVVWGLSLIMTVFMSILSVQTIVSGSADSVLLRTAKFAVSTGVPIVGGTISDAVGTVYGSLSVIKGAVGTYGIAAAAVIILPTLVKVACYRAAIACAEAAADMFGQKELCALLKSCGAVMAIISAVIASFLLLNTIAAVIMLAMGNGT